MGTDRPVIAVKVEPELKSAFADEARRRGQSESDFLREILGKVFVGKLPVAPAPSPIGFKNTKGKFQIRLRPDELFAVTELAKADTRSVPAWIVAMIRRVALKAVPFNDQELIAVNRAISALGPLGRNLNVMVKHFNQTGRGSAEDIQARQLAAAIKDLRSEIVALAGRASRRYSDDQA